MKRYLIILLSFFMTISLFGQEFDLLIKGGRVIDPANDLDGLYDVAIEDGYILEVAANIDTANAFQVIDATGLLVTPGIIDIHSHNFHGTEEDRYLANSFAALPPDGFSFRAGVTTIVDVGGAGWRNFKTFKKQTIDRSKTRVLAFINIVGAGMAGGAFEQNLQDMDARLTALEANAFKDHIVGVKVAHYFGPEWDPVERAVEAGRLANVPVMVDFGATEPPHSIETLFMEKLRPGDIFTHTFGHVPGRQPIVNFSTGKLEPFIMKAQERGIIFDVGHGGGSFRFDQAIPALEQGFKPNTISTDLHTGSMNGGMKSMLNVMSKFINIGMSIPEVIHASTWKPAQAIARTELGNLSKGSPADVAVLRVEEGSFGFIDVRGWKYPGTRKFSCEVTIRDGAVVYDLNGLSRPMWESR